MTSVCVVSAAPCGAAATARTLVVVALLTAPLWGDLAADRAAIDTWLGDGKFAEAAFFCREQITLAEKDTARRATYTAELLRVLTAEARQAPPQVAEPLWRAAATVGDRFVEQFDDAPVTILVRFQTAQATTLHTETEERTQTLTEEARGQALRRIREGLRRWEVVQGEIQTRLRTGGEGRGRPEEAMNANLLRSLADRARFGRARLLLCRGALYPSGSNDRMLACRQAVEQLEAIAPNHVGSVWWETRVALVRAHRVSGDRRRMETVAARLLEGPSLPPCVAQRIEAERLRMAILQQDWKTVEAALVAAPEDRDGSRCPEWDVAYLEALVALCSRPQESDEWSAKAREQLDRITSRYGPYWQRVAEATLARASSTGAPVLSDLAALRLRQGNRAGAREALQQSAEQAHGQGDRARAWRLRFEAARLGAELSDWHATMIQAAQLAASADAPDSQLAADAQLLAIKASARALRQGDTETAVYQGHLRRFVDHWPEHAQADRVRLWLGSLYQAQQEFEAATAQYVQIRPASAPHGDVVDRVGRAARRLPITCDTYAQAIAWLSEVSRGEGETETAALAARIWLARLSLIANRPSTMPSMEVKEVTAEVRGTAEALAGSMSSCRVTCAAQRFNSRRCNCRMRSSGTTCCRCCPAIRIKSEPA